MKHLKYKGKKTDFGVSKKGNIHRVYKSGEKYNLPFKKSKAGKFDAGLFIPNGKYAFDYKDLMAIVKYMKKQEL